MPASMAVSVSGPAARMPDDRITPVVAALSEAAARLRDHLA